ncbi:acyltransferase [Flavobacterium beibuense]|uniref:Hexapeptide repeat-containing transferase n=1 Tax=Flavobacterium beibuense TaxID=657326 RepID=A0A444WIT3_9FLAO|nr:acyltransferase [Flavobacterium beibuense]RYJ45592.1 Hexapeptide repeat-containing transferase [Flavobacterium beibuense]
MKSLKNQLFYVLPLWFVQLITNWLPDNRLVIGFRGWLAHFFIKECGKRFQLGRDVTLLNTSNLRIGDDVYIAKGSWLNAMGGLSIEDEVVIAPYVVVSTLQHVFKDNSVRFGGSIAGEVHIGKGTWLAAHSSVKCGVTIGKGNLVAANSFVVKSTKDNVILSGVPAVFVKKNEDGEASFFSRGEYEEKK